MKRSARAFAFAAYCSLLASCASGTVTSPSPAAPVPTPTPVTMDGVLLPGGIGPARFGDPVSEALPTLTALFGDSDDDQTIRSQDLYGYLAEPGKKGTLRQVTWDPLTVVFLDTTGTLAQDDVPFVAWHSGWTGVGRDFTTPEGIGVGSTLAELRAVYGQDLTVPDEQGGPCGIQWVFFASTPRGSYEGVFEEEPTTDEVRIESISAGQQPSC